MPNRIIKESICTSDTLAQLTAEEERLFYRLMVQADDFGIFEARPAIVLARCFSAMLGEVTVEQVDSWLDGLERAGIIQIYEVEGKPYLQFVTWEKHQRRRAKHSKYPLPPSHEGAKRQEPSSADNDQRVKASADTRNDLTADDSKRGQVPADDCQATTNDALYEFEESRNRETRSEEAEARRARAREGITAAAAVNGWGNARDEPPTPQLDKFFQENYGHNLYNLSSMRLWVEKGMEEKAVILALALAKERDGTITGINLPRSILQSWWSKGIRTYAQAAQHEQEFRERKLRARDAPEPPQELPGLPTPEELAQLEERTRRLREEGLISDA